MNEITSDPKFWFKYELDHFIDIGNRFDQLGIPQEYKPAFFRLLIESINEFFQLSVNDPCNGHQKFAWKTILRSYSHYASFEKTVADLRKNSGKCMKSLAQQKFWPNGTKTPSFSPHWLWKCRNQNS